MREKNMTFDAQPSVRSVDENGYMHVGASHITKAVVNPYYGREIPGWQQRGLDPEKIYYGFRDPDELQKSLTTWAGLPLHIEHHVDSADDPQKLTRVGSVGTEVVWNAPYVDAPLTIWDKKAIDAVESGAYRELSCAYRYDPDWTLGVHEGISYDFVMRNIRGNHVALVEEGRAGPDVIVADKNIKQPEGGTPMAENKQHVKDGDPEIEQKEVDLAQAIIDLHKVDPNTGEVVDIMEDEDKAKAVREIVGELAGKLEPEQLKRLNDALTDLAYSKATGDKTPVADNPYKDAMDKCGIDAENEEFQKAFAEGVKFGERKEKEEPGKLDREHESEGMQKFEEHHGEDQFAGDARPKGSRKQPMGMDAAAIKAQAVKETRQHMQELFSAVNAVRPLVGSLEPMSFDSATAVYGHTLKTKGIDPSKYDKSAWRGMVDILLRQQVSGFKPLAEDSAPVKFDGAFQNLKNIDIS